MHFSDSNHHRSSSIVGQIYKFNHPLTAQLRSEVNTKMKKMAANPFAFYRGTAHIFYEDMKILPLYQVPHSTKIITWIQGDMHLQNVGVLTNNKGQYIFDTNDIDEGYLSYYIWDLRRMVVSIILAAEENGINQEDQEILVKKFTKTYLEYLDYFQNKYKKQTYSLTADNTKGVVKDMITEADQSRTKFLNKYTHIIDGNRRFLNIDKLQQPVSTEIYTDLESAMIDYIQTIPENKRKAPSYYTLKDVCLKLGSGIGNLGKYRYYLLITGESDRPKDNIILEMKQESSSMVAIASPDTMPSSLYNNHQGKRVVMAMNAMLKNVDDLLGYTTMRNLHFVVREKSPYSADFDYTKLTNCKKFKQVVEYLAIILAKNYALVNQEDNLISIPDHIPTMEIINKKSDFQENMSDFAMNYAEQVNKDYQSFKNAYEKGVLSF
jgi:uncharacterized protein (DUF2252 family)